MLSKHLQVMLYLKADWKQKKLLKGSVKMGKKTGNQQTVQAELGKLESEKTVDSSTVLSKK